MSGLPASFRLLDFTHQHTAICHWAFITCLMSTRGLSPGISPLLQRISKMGMRVVPASLVCYKRSMKRAENGAWHMVRTRYASSCCLFLLLLLPMYLRMGRDPQGSESIGLCFIKTNKQSKVFITLELLDWFHLAGGSTNASKWKKIFVILISNKGTHLEYSNNPSNQ